MDVHENPATNTIVASFDLAGVEPEEVNIDVNQDHFTVSGETTADQEHDERGYTVREHSGKFSRHLMLPLGTLGTKPEDVHAKYA